MGITQGTAMWAFVQKPTQNYNRDGYEYSIDVQVDSAEAKRLQSEGLTVKDKDGKATIKFKLPVERKDGSKNDVPVIVDKDNMPYSGAGIGNGSKVRVKYRTYEWEFGRKKGVSAALVAVQVVDLVPYNEEGAEDFGPVSDNTAAPF